MIERVLWLLYAAQKPETPAWARAVMWSALGYFVSPVDAAPDVLPGGLTDDLGVLVAALATVGAFVDEEVRERTKRTLDHWLGTQGAEIWGPEERTAVSPGTPRD